MSQISAALKRARRRDIAAKVAAIQADRGTLRYRLLHLPAKLATHARRVLSICDSWPWANAHERCWQRLNALPAAT